MLRSVALLLFVVTAATSFPLVRDESSEQGAVESSPIGEIIKNGEWRMVFRIVQYYITKYPATTKKKIRELLSKQYPDAIDKKKKKLRKLAEKVYKNIKDLIANKQNELKKALAAIETEKIESQGGSEIGAPGPGMDLSRHDIQSALDALTSVAAKARDLTYDLNTAISTIEGLMQVASANTYKRQFLSRRRYHGLFPLVKDGSSEQGAVESLPSSPIGEIIKNGEKRAVASEKQLDELDMVFRIAQYFMTKYPLITKKKIKELLSEVAEEVFSRIQKFIKETINESPDVMPSKAKMETVNRIISKYSTPGEIKKLQAIYDKMQEMDPNNATEIGEMKNGVGSLISSLVKDENMDDLDDVSKVFKILTQAFTQYPDAMKEEIQKLLAEKVYKNIKDLIANKKNELKKALAAIEKKKIESQGGSEIVAPGPKTGLSRQDIQSALNELRSVAKKARDLTDGIYTAKSTIEGLMQIASANTYKRQFLPRKRFHALFR